MPKFVKNSRNISENSEDSLNFFNDDVLNEPVFESSDAESLDNEEDIIENSEEINIRTRFRSSRSRCYTDPNRGEIYSREEFITEMAHQLQLDHVKRIVG